LCGNKSGGEFVITIEWRKSRHRPPSKTSPHTYTTLFNGLFTAPKRNESMDEIKDFEDEQLQISHGGLYTPFPVPAYKILAAARKHVAKDVLVCLVSHLGKTKRKAYPSISLIMRESGRGRTAVIAGIRVLEDFGFVKKYQFWEPGKKLRNIYYLQDACWNNDRMNRDAMAFAPVVGRCGCGSPVKLGEVGMGLSTYHHYGCGDVVTLLSTRKKPSVEMVQATQPTQV
jgi:hypothetical protein